jgi:RimJ/RimL family protein N-acetyltransferase
MTAACADRIAGWTYPGQYAIYSFSHNDETIRELLDGSYFARLDADGEPEGYYCFGASARIPTADEDAYAAEALDVGLGMRPDLCGKGGGAAFLADGLEFARATFGAARFRLTVAAFNVRAIRAYEKAGFAVEKRIMHKKSGMAFLVMARRDAH